MIKELFSRHRYIMTFLWIALLTIAAGAVFSIMQDLGSSPEDESSNPQGFAEYSGSGIEESNNDLESNANDNQEDSEVKSSTTLSSSSSGSGGGSSGGGSPDNGCTPQCSGKTCGDDGCGGVCGNCDDSVTCTIDSCTDANCVYTPDNSLCDDSNECTTDTCDVTNGCDYTNLADGTLCTGGTCQGGTCVQCSVDSDCDDSVSCTIDTCNAGTCSNTPNNNLCSTGEVCDLVYGCVSEITIDDDWLSAQGDEGPYYLTGAGTTYTLATDVTTNGSAFALCDERITFDLNGHTITFNDASVNPENHEFEEGTTTPTGWNMTNAPDMVLEMGRKGLRVPYYADEKAVTLEFPAQPQVMRSNEPIFLRANSTYAFGMKTWFLDENSMEKLEYPRAYVALEGAETLYNYSTIVWNDGDTFTSGTEYKRKVIDTGPEDGYYYVKVGIYNTQHATQGKYYIEGFNIAEYGIAGIFMGPRGYRREDGGGSQAESDVLNCGRADDATIKNGAIIQGKGKGDYNYGIRWSNGQRTNVINNTFRIHGPMTKAIAARWSDGHNISYNTMYNDVKHITSRHQLDNGPTMNFISGGHTVSYNNLIGSPHNGITIRGDGGSHVFGNNISINSKFTNGNGIHVRCTNCYVYDNFVNCSEGNRNCRGVMIASNKAEVFNNRISVQDLPNNLESLGCQFGRRSGTYAMQAESGENILFYNNNVTAFTRVCTSNALRLNPGKTESYSNFSVFNNTFTAIDNANTGEIMAAAMKFGKLYGHEGINERLFIFNNTFETNDKWYASSWVDGLRLINNEFKLIEPRVTNFYPLSAIAYRSSKLDRTRRLQFIGNKYADENSRRAFETAHITRYWNNNGDNDEYNNFSVLWPLTITVKDSSNNPVQGATVSLESSGQELSYTNLTIASGTAKLEVEGYSYNGSARTDRNPYTITIDKIGFDSHTNTIEINKTMEVTITLS